MKKVTMLFMMFFLLSALLYAGGPKQVEEGWSDDFSGGKLSNRWMASTGGLGFSPKYVDMSKGMLGLKLTQTKNKKGEFVSLGAEVQTREVYGFGTYTWEMRSSSTAAEPNAIGVAQSGSSSGIFSFLDDSAVEIDFEVEGNRPQVVWAVNWHKPKWSVKGTRVQSDTGFHEYKYVWSKDRIEYYINGKEVWVVTENVPQKPSFVIMNHWGTSTTKWGGTPTEGTRYMWVRRFSFEPEK